MNSSEIKTEVAKYEEIHKKMEQIYGEAFNFDRIFCAYNAIVVHVRIIIPLNIYNTVIILNYTYSFNSFSEKHEFVIARLVRRGYFY